jgi:tetratricopeptide (TPR) repeat protein
MRNPHLSGAANSGCTAAEYNLLGVQAMLKSALREASYYFLSAVVRDPAYWPAFFNLGNAWSRLQDDQAALWAYQQALGYCEDYAPLFVNLGILHCRLGRHEEALPYLDRAFSLNPGSAQCVAALGYVCYRLGELGLAWHWYSRAMALKPDDSTIRISLQAVGEKIAEEIQ